MSGHRNRRSPWVAAAAAMALLAVGTAPAMAHTHPTPIERASPGVVYIEARAKVEVALIEHRQAGDSFGVHIGIIQSTWNPVLATASGFVVDPTGGIVTTGSITRTDLDRARIFAVNQAFHQRYFDAAPLPKDPFSRNRLGGSGDRNEERLEACYPPNRTNDAGGCVVRVTPDFVVYPYVTSQTAVRRPARRGAAGRHQGRRGPARPRRQQHADRGRRHLDRRGEGTGRARFHRRARSGQPAAGGQPAPGHRGRQVAEDDRPRRRGRPDAARLGGAAPGPGGRPGAGRAGTGHWAAAVGAAPGQRGSAAGGVDSVLPVLQKAGVSPHGGPVDTSFEAAMHLFKNGGYAASVPGFTKALELFPGHFLASRNARHRQAARSLGQHGVRHAQGTVNGTGAGDHGAPTARRAVWAGSGAGLLIVVTLVATAAVLLVRRRRQGGAQAAAAGPTTGRPDLRWPTASRVALRRGASCRRCGRSGSGGGCHRGGRRAAPPDRPVRVPAGATPAARPRTAEPSSSDRLPAAAVSGHRSPRPPQSRQTTAVTERRSRRRAGQPVSRRATAAGAGCGAGVTSAGHRSRARPEREPVRSRRSRPPGGRRGGPGVGSTFVAGPVTGSDTGSTSSRGTAFLHRLRWAPRGTAPVLWVVW